MAKLNLENMWISLGLRGALEMMDASCTLAERLDSNGITNELCVTIANEIVSKRDDS